MNAPSPHDGSPTPAPAHHELRRSWRHPVVATATLTSPDPATGAAGQRLARVVNLSAGGVGMIAAAPLSPYSEFAILITGHPARSGRIRIVHCRPTRDGYEIGAQFLPAPGD